MPANPSFSSNGTLYTFSGQDDAEGNFAVGHVAATTAIISSNSAACNSTVGAAVEIVPYSATRVSVTICNRTNGAETIDLGSASVAVGSGIPVVPGGSWTFTGPGAAGPIYAASPIASTPISWVEM